MDDLGLLIDLHIEADRQGPGSDAMTRRAIDLAGLSGRHGLTIADVGCGTGASTLVLARELDARIAAVDLLPEFLERLALRAEAAGVADRIATHVASMDALPFADASLDAIWSEGAVYNIGFERGVQSWRRFLKPGGILALSELTWFTADRPAELERHWRGEYPEVDTVSAKMAVIERNGYAPLGWFALPEDCWTRNYYEPMRRRFGGFLRAHGMSDASRAVVAAEEREIALHERHHAFFGYGFYLARRVDPPRTVPKSQSAI